MFLYCIGWEKVNASFQMKHKVSIYYFFVLALLLVVGQI